MNVDELMNETPTKPCAVLYTTRQYPCGCRAQGTGDVPSYCASHGRPPPLDHCAALEADNRELTQALERIENEACDVMAVYIAREALNSPSHKALYG
jgi:hypothetical protein